MNCATAQHRLLGSSDPARPRGELRTHVQHCPRCRAWRSRLAQLELAVATLPVPSASTAKSTFLRSLTAVEEAPWPAPAPHARPAPVHRSARRRPTRLRWFAAAATGSVAAGLLLAFGGFLSTVRDHTPAPAVAPSQPDALLARVLQRDLELANAASPRARVEALADLADDLDGETRYLARVAAGDDLTALAALYERVVRQGILIQANELHQDERRKVLVPIADRLFRAGQDAEGLAGEVPPGSAEPLRTIAAAARDANRQLRRLAQEGQS